MTLQEQRKFVVSSGIHFELAFSGFWRHMTSLEMLDGKRNSELETWTNFRTYRISNLEIAKLPCSSNKYSKTCWACDKEFPELFQICWILFKTEWHFKMAQYGLLYNKNLCNLFWNFHSDKIV